MFAPDQYALLDVGGGRKLERFGRWLLDRPCPAARHAPHGPWNAHARYARGRGSEGMWELFAELPQSWCVCHGKLQLELKLTPFGHVGLFPEQAENWDWLTEQVGRWRSACGEATFRLLNLFAYTGGSTLAAAGAGAEVVHVDAAANIVAWARRNAALSGLVEAPIRWIVDDARKFVRREVRRGRRYQGLVLDPPGYGHGAGGEAWTLKDDLPALLGDCAALLDGRQPLILLTCHAPDLQADDLPQMLRAAGIAFKGERGELLLHTADGRVLESGLFARCGPLR